MSIARSSGGTSRDRAAAVRARHGFRAGIDGLVDLVRRLLGPAGCPWDRAQTLASLRPYVVEEAHEVADAQVGAPSHHREELGDLLFQIVLQAALREKEGSFGFDDVVDGILVKMVARHPHVFGDGPHLASAKEVERAWAARKREERAAAETSGEPSAFDPLEGVPRSLPSLVRAYRLQEKAAAVGFDWPSPEAVAAKVEEEWRELRQAMEQGDSAAVEEELGDVLFVLVRLAQKLGVDPDLALGRATAKFERRFAHVVERLHREGTPLAPEHLDRMEAAWEEAKRIEQAGRAGAGTPSGTP